MSEDSGHRNTPDAALLSELEATVGAEGIRPTTLSMLGAEVEYEVAPADGESLGRVLELLDQHAASAVVRGGGTHDELGNRLGPVSVALSTRRLDGIDEFDQQDGVVRVRAGTSIAALRAQVGAHRWDVALDTSGLSPSNASTVGGTLAAAAFGARRLGFGAPRDCVLGLDVALPSGQRTRCGARVVKNVTGYDLQKLYCGSFGSLGVIESAWLRLRPVPERIASLVAPVADPSDPVGASLGLAIARRSTARSVAIVDARSVASLALLDAGVIGPGGFALVVEFAGPSAAVDDDLSWTRARCEAVPAPSGVIDAVSALPTRSRSADHGASTSRVSGSSEADAPELICARFAMLPSAVSHSIGELEARGAAVVAHPGVGIVYASWEPTAAEPDTALDARGIVHDIEHIRGEVRATVRFERLPMARRETAQVDVFGALERGELQLMRSLKQKFDPARTLNPGRFAGQI